MMRVHALQYTVGGKPDGSQLVYKIETYVYTQTLSIFQLRS